MTLGEQIVAEARSYVGVPFFHTGRDRNGVDCAGLILATWTALGLTDYDFRNYAPGGDVRRLRAGLERFCEEVTRTLLSGPPMIRAGDVLLLAIKGHAIHAGIATGAGTFVHALEQPGRVVEVPLDEHWRKRIVSVWRWREAS